MNNHIKGFSELVVVVALLALVSVVLYMVYEITVRLFKQPDQTYLYDLTLKTNSCAENAISVGSLSNKDILMLNEFESMVPEVIKYVPGYKPGAYKITQKCGLRPINKMYGPYNYAYSFSYRIQSQNACYEVAAVTRDNFLDKDYRVMVTSCL